MADELDENKGHNSEKVLQKHIRILGPNLGGAAVGGVLGGPVGAVVGAGVTYAASEVLRRILAPRQVLRIDTVLTAAEERMMELASSGRELRSDGFFDEKTGERSDWEEVAEGVLVTAMTDYEEKKSVFYGYLIANIAFEPRVDRGAAHSVMRLAQQLSYRQLCFLALVPQKRDRFPLPAKPRRSNVEWSTGIAQRDLDELGFAHHELVSVEPKPDKRLPTNIGVPSDLRLTSRGTLLYVLMELSRIEDEDLQDLSELLNR